MLLTGDAFGQPAVVFEQAHGLTGIAGRYRFPEGNGLDRLSLQHRIWPAYGVQHLPHDEMVTIISHLEKLNPELVSQIQFNRNVPKELRDVVHGMVSGFNVDDINLFMKRATSGIDPNKLVYTAEEVARDAFEAKIMQRLKINNPIQWVASEQTLEKIWQQVKDRPIITTLERATEMVKKNSAAWAIGVGVAAVGGYLVGQAFVRKSPSNDHVSAYLAEKTDAEPSIKM